MRNPLRSEADAFGYVIATGAIAVAVGVMAWVGGTGAGLGVLLGAAVGVSVGLYLRSGAPSREPPVWEQTGEARWHVLVLAAGACSGRFVFEEVSYRARGRTPEALVVVPAGPAAQPLLDALVASLTAAGIAVRGEVGEPDPPGALAGALATFEADEVLVCTGVPDGPAWPGQAVVARIREACHLPVTHVVDPGDGSTTPPS
ncbi:MAG: hypothetical protein KJ051_06140 [Thermoleophilia bacterium]|nr:hypothetical protein [Thermoleophilia bacterium]